MVTPCTDRSVDGHYVPTSIGCCAYERTPTETDNNHHPNEQMCDGSVSARAGVEYTVHSRLHTRLAWGVLTILTVDSVQRAWRKGGSYISL